PLRSLRSAAPLMQVKDAAAAWRLSCWIGRRMRGRQSVTGGDWRREEAGPEEAAMTKPAISELILHRSPIVMRDNATVQEACKVMQQHRIGAIIVVDEQKRPVGIFTGRDAVNRVLAKGPDGKRTLLRDVMTG